MQRNNEPKKFKIVTPQQWDYYLDVCDDTEVHFHIHDFAPSFYCIAKSGVREFSQNKTVCPN